MSTPARMRHRLQQPPEAAADVAAPDPAGQGVPAAGSESAAEGSSSRTLSSGAQGTAIRDDDATTAVSSHPQNRSRAAASSNEPAEHPETSRSNSEQVSTHPEQPNRDQTVLAVLLLVALSVLCWNYCQLTSRRPDGLSIIRSSSEIGYRIDINSATWIELSQLEGIGPVIARRIVDDRERRGPFASIDDLQRVRGIGPRTVERNRRWMQAAPPERP